MVVRMTDSKPQLTSQQKANQASRLAAQIKRADYLRERGWFCVGPDEIESLSNPDYVAARINIHDEKFWKPQGINWKEN